MSCFFNFIWPNFYVSLIPLFAVSLLIGRLVTATARSFTGGSRWRVRGLGIGEGRVRALLARFRNRRRDEQSPWEKSGPD